MLPQKDGLEVPASCPDGVSTPIVMLRANSGEFLGLDLGAHDYVQSLPARANCALGCALRHQSGESATLDLQRQLRVARDVQQRLFPKHRPATLTMAHITNPRLA